MLLARSASVDEGPRPVDVGGGGAPVPQIESELPMVGFAPPLLGDKPYRLPIYARAEGWFCLEKPPGVPLGDWHSGLVGGINRQVSAGKPELQRLAITSCGPVFHLPEEIGGPVLLAMGKNALTQLRNAYGSRQLLLDFAFWTREDTGEGPDERSCDRLIFESPGQPPRLHRQEGKRAETAFRRVWASSGWGLWEASVSYLRAGQLRLHAEAVGLPVADARVWMAQEDRAGVRWPRLAAGWGGPLARLAGLSGLPGVPAVRPIHRPWEAMGRALRRYAGGV